ncbi:MAG: hypothetical protein DWQ34_21285 [Planctomycetota bacterium]|nr:MAG: hypothetical protein DWQ29_24035 [Planctomycetota bacterium]REJ88799.1 MAG: hypothetical protein DWQ34_21285 [Planctomycetota bacterium]REK29497.1 MAG: hypothetical protein DWQ41_04270 [Planctomycetota bacterium]REK31862.1 MAG: hypothetical protein DWQ45_18520 [Planctomycetota bacterium]
MPRRIADSDDSISLFPFMSILVCLIGSLTLMITALMAGQASQDQSQEIIERHEEFTRIEADMAADRSELDALRELIADALDMQKDLELALAEVAELEKEQSERLERMDVASDYAQMLAEANRLRQRIAEIENDPAELQKQIDELQAEIERMQAGPEEAVVQVRPGGSGVDIEPTFVECTANGVVVHKGDEPLQIRTGDLDSEEGEFRKLLARVAATPKAEIVFLVRPDGVSTYNRARSIARTFYTADGYARNGKLPVPSQGNIDLSVFSKL